MNGRNWPPIRLNGENPKAPDWGRRLWQWLQSLSLQILSGGNTRFVIRPHWAYVRVSVRDGVLVLDDFATKEAHADALVYILQWVAREVSTLECKWVTSTQDMCRIHKLCE